MNNIIKCKLLLTHALAIKKKDKYSDLRIFHKPGSGTAYFSLAVKQNVISVNMTVCFLALK